MVVNINYTARDTTVSNEKVGTGNNVCGHFSILGGGQSNRIGSNVASEPLADWNFIGGGAENWINSTGSATFFGVIGGGEVNIIGPGTAHSGIFSGNTNTVTGSCSAILGGANNNDAGLNNVHIAGSGINAVLANTMHINALWASAIPFLPGGVGSVPGQIYWDVPPAPDANPRALYIG